MPRFLVTNKLNKGFTIIEVMIVLAIAGVIMGIVFLAIPNLQRNSRNNQMRSDANNLLSLINEYSSINNGTVPTWIRYNPETGLIRMGTGTTADPTATDNNGKIRTGLNGGGTTVVNLHGTVAAATGINTLLVGLQRKCSTSTVGQINTATTVNRAVAITYQLETAGTNNTNVCIDA